MTSWYAYDISCYSIPDYVFTMKNFVEKDFQNTLADSYIWL